jgi:hypothetical protein
MPRGTNVWVQGDEMDRLDMPPELRHARSYPRSFGPKLELNGRRDAERRRLQSKTLFHLLECCSISVAIFDCGNACATPQTEAR